MKTLSSQPGITPVAPIGNQSKPTAPGARISSDTLLAGAAELEIDHNGVVYRLRKTSLGKLILTK